MSVTEPEHGLPHDSQVDVERILDGDGVEPACHVSARNDQGMPVGDGEGIPYAEDETGIKDDSARIRMAEGARRIRHGNANERRVRFSSVRRAQSHGIPDTATGTSVESHALKSDTQGNYGGRPASSPASALAAHSAHGRPWVRSRRAGREPPTPGHGGELTDRAVAILRSEPLHGR